MNTNLSLREILKMVLKLSLVVSVSIILGIGSYRVIINKFPTFSILVSGEKDWYLLEGFASVISLALLFGGLTFALLDYIGKERAERKEKLAEEREKAKLSYDIYRAINDKITDPKQEAARRWILENIEIKKDNEPVKVWYETTQKKVMKKAFFKKGLPEGQEAIKLTLNCFDYVGFIADHYWNPDGDSIEWISAPIAKVWIRIGPYVEYVAILRDVEDYYKSAQNIGNLCVEWRENKGWEDEIYAENTL